MQCHRDDTLRNTVPSIRKSSTRGGHIRKADLRCRPLPPRDERNLSGREVKRRNRLKGGRESEREREVAQTGSVNASAGA